MNHYVYRIENIETKEFYVGVRSCKCDIKDDKYMGTSSVWTKSYIKTNQAILVKHIVNVLDSRSIANKAELDLLLMCEGNPLCVNKNYRVMPSTLGIAHTEEARAKISQFQKGRPKPDSMKIKISAYQKGKKVSEETKAKASATVKAKYEAGYRQKTTKPVIVHDLELDTITEYPSNTDFCKVYGFDKQSVGVFIRKGTPYKKRFKVEYKTQEIEGS